MLTCYPITRPVRTTAPTLLQEPVTLAEAKKQCEVAEAVGYHDDHLSRLIVAARETVENDTGIVCYTGTFTWKFTHWPDDEWFEIRAIRPVTSITSIAYLDGSGTSQTWAASNYSLETSTVTPLVRVTYGNTYPTIRGDVNGITVTLVAGYATVQAVPVMVKQAILFLINHWFVSRDIVSIGTISPDITMTYDALVNRLMRCSYP